MRAVPFALLAACASSFAALTPQPAWARVPVTVTATHSAVAATDDPMVRAADQDPAVRQAAAAALAVDPRPQALALLIVLLQRDVDPRVRRAAALALGTMPSADLAPLLASSSKHDSDAQVRAAARESYERLWPLGKRPGVAAGLSVLCPGCGHIYLRRSGKGLAFLGATIALTVSGAALLLEDGGVHLGDPDDPRLEPSDPIGLQLLMAGQNLWFYSIFSAYRDARVARGDAGYAHPVSRESLTDLASAPFRPSVLKSPWVWAGVPLALGAAVGLIALAAPEQLQSGDRSLVDGGDVNFLGRELPPAAGIALGEAYFGALFTPVAVGEEALFRGVLQAALSEPLGEWGGWAVASVAFGAVHITNFSQDNAGQALVAVPFITAVGATLGLAYMRTGHRLETSVAMHFWYDFLLSTVSFVADPDHQPFVARFGTAF